MSKVDVMKWASSSDGKFRRLPSVFRNNISPNSDFPPEAGRYHLYVSYACPWAHRTLITRKLKGLDDAISFSVVHPYMGPRGWSFRPPVNEGKDDKGIVKLQWYADKFGDSDSFSEQPNVGDSLYNNNYLSQLYFKTNPDYEGRFTVPILWDKKNQTIVNNESSEIIRILNSDFQDIAKNPQTDLYPESLRKEIDDINSYVYDNINNGVYKCGFATSSEAYSEEFANVSQALDKIEKQLQGKKYLVGDQLTEADIRLYVTIIRFDPVYYSHFKVSSGLIRHTYPNINNWVKNLYWNYPAFQETTHFDHIKAHYFGSHVQINPTRIIPVGPIPNIEKL